MQLRIKKKKKNTNISWSKFNVCTCYKGPKTARAMRFFINCLDIIWKLILSAANERRCLEVVVYWIIITTTCKINALPDIFMEKDTSRKTNDIAIADRLQL